MKKILIIKHGSLGDIIFALPVMQSIKTKYSNCEIDILSEKKFFNFLKKTNFFNCLIEDNRSKNLFSIIRLLKKLLNKEYDLIIDLQNSKRTSYYNLIFRLLDKCLISSSRRFAQLRYHIPPQGFETGGQGLFNQLKLLNIKEVKNLNYNWLKVELDNIYEKKTILFIPGVSKRGGYKKWDSFKFGETAKYCEKKGYQICVIGTKFDKESALQIINKCKKIINCIDKSPPEVIYSIAKKSKLIISNDTGPGHIAALSGTNILWLLNDNKIAKANIENKSTNFKILSKKINDISSLDVIQYIEKNNLL